MSTIYILKQKGYDIMIEKDTVRLLRECDAGAKMGISTIEETMQFSLSEPLKKILEHSREQHLEMSRKINERLARFSDDGKDPPMMAELMGKVKANFRMVTEETDKAAADLISDGCSMGIRSLSKYLNEYKAAEEYSKDIAKKLIAIEDRLSVELRSFL